MFVIQQSRMLTYRDEFGPGPGMLPLWLGGLLTVLAVGQVILGIRNLGTEEKLRDGGKIRNGLMIFAPSLNFSSVPKLLLTCGGLIATVAALEVLGFLVSFGLLSFFLVYVIERRSLPRSIAVAVAITLAFLLVFRVMLPVQLPLNVWGF